MFLITRPLEKAENTKSIFDQAGLPAFVCPAQKITPLSPEIDNPEFDDISAYDIAIVTSTYAAEWLGKQKFKIKQIIAIGAATQESIKQNTDYSENSIQVPEQSNSEGVLEMPIMSAVSGKKVLLIKGVDGRQLLEDTLKKRGANITIAETYRRQSNINDLLVRQVEELPIKCIIVTSTEIAALIIKHLRADWLSDKYWVAASERIADFLRSHDFTQVSTSHGASDAAVVKAAAEVNEKLTG